MQRLVILVLILLISIGASILFFYAVKMNHRGVTSVPTAIPTAIPSPYPATPTVTDTPTSADPTPTMQPFGPTSMLPTTPSASLSSTPIPSSSPVPTQSCSPRIYKCIQGECTNVGPGGDFCGTSGCSGNSCCLNACH